MTTVSRTQCFYAIIESVRFLGIASQSPFVSVVRIAGTIDGSSAVAIDSKTAQVDFQGIVSACFSPGLEPDRASMDLTSPPFWGARPPGAAPRAVDVIGA